MLDIVILHTGTTILHGEIRGHFVEMELNEEQIKVVCELEQIQEAELQELLSSFIPKEFANEPS